MLLSHRIKPMLAKLVAEPFDRADWYFEVKWDGYRAIAEIEKGAIDLYSRNHISFLKKYPPVVKALQKIKHACVLDGEIIALKAGKPDFHALQQYEETPAPLQYAIFDLLYLNGRDLRHEPLAERKKLLRKILPKHPQLLFSEHIQEHGKKFFDTIRKRGLEGMVAKDSASPYLEGARTDAWQKIKSQHTQEAIIVGFTEPRGSRKNLGALVLAAYEHGKLVYIGHSGGGFTQKELTDLCATLKKIAVKKSPLTEDVPINAPITWVQPKYVCEIQFTEWTPDGRMRHPIYKGLRVDKKPTDVMKEIPAMKNKKRNPTLRKPEAPQQFTHRDKVFWPDEGYTKGDVIDYYDRMAAVMLPYLKDRPENLNRHPNGWKGKSFYQKDITMDVPDFVEIAKIWSESNGKHLHYLLCQNKETLLYLANLGCIEINPWNSRVGRLEKPDYMIIDLDPGDNTFEQVIRVAQEVHKVLDLACEDNYVKTSGKTGLHIFVPFGGKYAYNEIKTFAQLIAQMVHQRLPDITSIERSPAKRKNKIYIDYLQNRKGQTIAAPYSLRPYPGATVSTPLEWREVKKGLDPAKFTIRTIEKRLKQKGDLWKPVLEKQVDLTEAVRCLQRHLERRPSEPFAHRTRR